MNAAFASVLALIGRAFDELDALDPESLTDDELHALVLGLQRQQTRVEATGAQAISAWDRRMVWADNGARSAAARLATETRSSMSSARARVRRARRLRTMPNTAEAFAAGSISSDHVDLLARARSGGREAQFADHEADLVGHCTDLRYSDARRVIEYWRQHADAEAAEFEGERRCEAARLSVSSTLDGTVVLDAVLDPISGEIVGDEIHRLERELHLANRNDSTIRTAAQRRAAALVEMASRSRTAPADGRRPRPLFTVLVGDESVDRLCELTGGAVLTPNELARWARDADLETVLFDGPSTVISVSHRRTFSGALRRAVQVRDRRCQHRSGCDERSDRCDVDHIVPHAESGPTSQFNGKLECPPHNRNSDRHAYGEAPRPHRTIDRLDELRCRLRWRFLREVAANPEYFADVTGHGDPDG